MPTPVGIVMKPPRPDAYLPQGRKRHYNPNGEVVWINDTTTITPGSRVTIEPGAQLGVDVILAGNTFVAEAEVGNGVEITNGVLKEGCRVGDNSTVVNSTVGERSHIGQSNEVRDATIGYDVVSGVGEQITGPIGNEAVIKDGEVTETKVAV